MNWAKLVVLGLMVISACTPEGQGVSPKDYPPEIRLTEVWASPLPDSVLPTNGYLEGDSIWIWDTGGTWAVSWSSHGAWHPQEGPPIAGHRGRLADADIPGTAAMCDRGASVVSAMALQQHVVLLVAGTDHTTRLAIAPVRAAGSCLQPSRQVPLPVNTAAYLTRINDTRLALSFSSILLPVYEIRVLNDSIALEVLEPAQFLGASAALPEAEWLAGPGLFLQGLHLRVFYHSRSSRRIIRVATHNPNPKRRDTPLDLPMSLAAVDHRNQRILGMVGGLAPEIILYEWRLVQPDA